MRAAKPTHCNGWASLSYCDLVQPWNYFYHVTSNTKRTWLRGDPRGWRARHHREHVEGDYKHPPPPGKYRDQFETSKSLLKEPPVILSWEQRLIACRTMAEAFAFHNIWFEDIAVTAKHFHVLLVVDRDSIEAAAPIEFHPVAAVAPHATATLTIAPSNKNRMTLAASRFIAIFQFYATPSHYPLPQASGSTRQSWNYFAGCVAFGFADALGSQY